MSVVFVDIKHAFDTIYHNSYITIFLCIKLYKYGIGEGRVIWPMFVCVLL